MDDVTAHPRTVAVDDTARRHIEALARRVLAWPNMSIEDELAMATVLRGEALDRAFAALCDAIRQGDHAAAETVLDLLTGRLR